MRPSPKLEKLKEYMRAHEGSHRSSDLKRLGFSACNLEVAQRSGAIRRMKRGLWKYETASDSAKSREAKKRQIVATDFKAAERAVLENVTAPNPVTELVQLAMQTGIQMEKVNQLLNGRAALPGMDQVMALLKGNSP